MTRQACRAQRGSDWHSRTATMTPVGAYPDSAMDESDVKARRENVRASRLAATSARSSHAPDSPSIPSPPAGTITAAFVSPSRFLPVGTHVADVRSRPFRQHVQGPVWSHPWQSVGMAPFVQLAKIDADGRLGDSQRPVPAGGLASGQPVRRATGCRLSRRNRRGSQRGRLQQCKANQAAA